MDVIRQAIMQLQNEQRESFRKQVDEINRNFQVRLVMIILEGSRSIY